MIRRFTIWVSVLLVNIALLASSIIPHHHHEDEVCVIVTHCNSSHDSHEHGMESHEHEADNGKQCALVNEYIGSADSTKSVIVTVKKTKISVQDQNLAYYQLVISFLEVNSHPPEQDNYYTSLIVHSKGLRAPPLV